MWLPRLFFFFFFLSSLSTSLTTPHFAFLEPFDNKITLDPPWFNHSGSLEVFSQKRRTLLT
jgi:hypothetical protein